MQLQPHDRYATALELAEDIDRWMNDEVPHAHQEHEGMLEKSARLIRRYRSWTISGAAALCLTTVGAVVAAFLIDAARQNEQKAKTQATLYKQDAVERYRDSREAIDRGLVQSTDALEYFPGTQEVRARLLQLATEDYEKLSNRDSEDPQLELERGRAMVRLGDLNQMQLDYEAAIKHYDAAALVLDDSVHASANDDLFIQFRSERANLHTRRGLAFASQEKTSEATGEFAKAIDRLGQIIKESDAPLPRRLLAVAHVNAGELYSRTKDNDKAVHHLQEGLRHYRFLEGDVDTKRELGVARTRELLGRLYTRLGEHELAITYFNESIESLEPLVAKEPDHPDYLDALASAYLTEANGFRIRGLEEQLFSALRSSLQHYRALRVAMPNVPRYKENLGLTLTDLGIALHESGQNNEAMEVLMESEEVLASLVANYGTVPRFGEALGACRDGLGQVLTETSEDPQPAVAMSASALKTYQQLVQQVGDQPVYFQRLAVVQSHYARALDRNGDTEQAKQHFAGSISTLEKLVELQGQLPGYVNVLAHVHDHYGRHLDQLDDPQSSVHFRNAGKLWKEIDGSATGRQKHDLAWLLLMCPDESVQDFETALQLAKDAVELSPENPNYAAVLALANTFSGKTDEAIQILEKTKSQRGSWIDSDLFVLALAQFQSGEKEEALKSMSDGEKWMTKNRPYSANVRSLLELVRSRMGDNVE
jgi:tetratricopeptide (TPR) repeat protein